MALNLAQMLLPMVLLLLRASPEASALSLVICVEDESIHRRLSSELPEASGFALKYVHVRLSASLLNVSGVSEVQRQLNVSRCQAVISDYYVTLGIASLSLSPPIPYFVIRNKVKTYPPSVANLFEIEIDNFHLSYALYDLSRYYKHRSLAIVTDGKPGSAHFLVHFEDKLFSLHSVQNDTSDAAMFAIFAQQDPNSLYTGHSWILLFSDGNQALMQRTLSQAARAGALQASQFFFIPSLLDHDVHLQTFYRSDAEFYTFRLASGLRYAQELHFPFVIDCVRHFAMAYGAALRNGRGLLYSLTSLSLHDSTLTGPYAYNVTTHVRSGVELGVLRSNRSAPASSLFTLAGTWTERSASPFRPAYTRDSDISRSLIRFGAVEFEPYLYYDLNGVRTGLGVEVVKILSESLGFDYEIVVASDNVYGEKLPNGSWTGVMKLLHEDRADVTLNFMTPRSDRLEIADKSVDLAEDGIQMMTRKVIHSQDFLHAFHPFSVFVWLSILLAMLMLTITLFVSDKISPNTRGKPMFTLFESFFLVFSSFLMSKVETEPRKLSSRLFTLLLWFSTLMYVTTYLSNLVAFFVKPDNSLPFSVLQELHETQYYKWGFLRGSSVVLSVRENWPKVHERAVSEWPSEMYFSDFDGAIERLLSDPMFVMIASADSLSFVKNRDCKLRVLSGIEGSSFLTLLFRKGFRFKDLLNRQLKELKETNLVQLRSKYFELSRCSTGRVDIENRNQLSFNYLCGIFLFLGIGCGLGFLHIFIQWVYSSLRELCRRQRGHSLVRGSDYEAEVYRLTPDGIWIHVCGQSEMHFLSNACLDPAASAVRSAASRGIRVSDSIWVRYYGKEQVTGAKVFVRSPAEEKKYAVGEAVADETSI